MLMLPQSLLYLSTPIFAHTTFFREILGHSPTVNAENKPNGKTFYKTTDQYSSKVSKFRKTKKD